MTKKSIETPKRNFSNEATKETKRDNNHTDEEGSIDIGACSLCHCALDYSDRAAFFNDDREEDYKEKSNNDDASSESSYFFGKDDPYLPNTLWDPNNALVYCDSCERMYHQKCHFVPIFSVPRGAWHCLYCISQKQRPMAAKKSKTPKATNAHKKREIELLPEFFKQLDAAKNIMIPESIQSADSAEPTSVRDLLFVSPPIPQVSEWEQRWEAASRFLKASTWHSTFLQMRNAITGQLATHRLAQTGLQTWTSTSHNFHFFQNSQELHDTLIKMFGTQYRIRSWLLAIESCRSTWPGEKMWQTLHEWTNKHQASHPEFIKRVLFPFGLTHPRRIEPKTPEYRLHRDDIEKSIPDEINIHNGTKNGTAVHKANASTKSKKKEHIAMKQASTAKNNDEDSGITLDDLVCCVCMENHATDENDLVLCDGHGCFRAYHQHCVKPAISLSGDEDEDDWFCPLCSGQADLLHHVQTEYMGDEWEQRRIERQLIAEEIKSRSRKKKPVEHMDNSSSLRSWADVQEVFPNSEVDYAAALLLRKGKKNAASNALVARILGLDETSNGQLEDDNDDDDNDLEDDEQFDLNSYEQRKLEERENARIENDASSGNISTDSSAATLVEMSSVELDIDDDELAALSDNETDAGSEDGKTDSKIRALSRTSSGMRLRSKRTYNNAIGFNVGDIGKLDESNIIEGKRGRVPVDYIVLNRSLFGDLSNDEVAEIDDGEDFIIQPAKSKKLDRCDNSTSASSAQSGSNASNSSSHLSSASISNDQSSKSKRGEAANKRILSPSCDSHDESGSRRTKNKRKASKLDIKEISELHKSSKGVSMAKKAINFVSNLVSGG